ncbi:MAG: FAD-dependent oxidoreductase [Bilophila wadsworthia]
MPEHLVVVGGGVIGCELAFIYRAFGAKVTVIEGQGRLLPLPSVDGEISRLLLREMKKKGIAVELSHTVSRVTSDGGAAVEIAPFPTGAGDSRVLNASAVCVTVGRVPNTAGLAEAGIALDQRGWIVVDDTLETSVPGVYAIGDVTGPRRIMLAHMAAAEAHTAVHNILHPERKVQSIRWFLRLFLLPEIGDGIDGRAGPRAGIAVRSAVFQFRNSARQAMGALSGLFKIVAEEGTGKLLGVHIAGRTPRILIVEITLPFRRGARHGISLKPSMPTRPFRKGCTKPPGCSPSSRFPQPCRTGPSGAANSRRHHEHTIPEPS